MKAVILAAGKSTRMYPLTLTRPKPMLKILNKPIIEHTLNQLEGIIDEAIIVVGYKKEMIIDYLGNEFNGIKIIYVDQKEQLGTGHAIMYAKDHINDDEKFLIIPGDDLYSKDDIKNCIKHDYSILVKEYEKPETMGVIYVDDNNDIIEIIEKPDDPKSNIVSSGLLVMDKKIIDLMENMEKTKRDEYELPCAISELLKLKKVKAVMANDYWIPIGYPWDLLLATEHLMKNLQGNIQGKVHEHATIDGNLMLGEGSEILPGVMIEGNVIIGKDSKIGPNCYIRGSTIIGDKCRVGQSVEIKNSIIGDGSKVPHLSYVGDSVIGNDVNFGAGTIVSNLRHDNASIKTEIKGGLIDTGRRKFGTIVGDNVHTGINTSIYPGRKFWPDTTTKPGEKVKRDVKND